MLAQRSLVLAATKLMRRFTTGNGFTHDFRTESGA